MLNLRRCSDITDIYETRKHEEFSYSKKYLKIAETIIKFIHLPVNGGEIQATINQSGNNIGNKSFMNYLKRKKCSPTGDGQIKASDMTDYLSEHLHGELLSLDNLYKKFWEQLRKEIKLQVTFKRGNLLAELIIDGSQTKNMSPICCMENQTLNS